MSFRDNLQHLRATRNMTQEQLAMMVGVSRQSVTKWEAERAYPEMDKLLKLCQIFDCTLDELVQGDLTTREAQPELAIAPAALAEDVIGYDEHHRSYALRIALGVVCCILGAATASLLEAFFSDAASVFGLLLFVGSGLLLIIPAAIEHGAYQKAHPYVADFYGEDRRLAEKRTYGYRLAAGICVIFVGVVAAALLDGRMNESLIGAMTLTLIAVGVGLIVYASFVVGRLDIEDYNISALEELTEEEIAGIVGEDRAPQVLAKVRRNKRKSAVCGIIMLVATAIALPLMFWATTSGQQFWTKFFWIPWMVGGLLCAVASIAIDMQQ